MKWLLHGPDSHSYCQREEKAPIRLGAFYCYSFRAQLTLFYDYAKLGGY